MQCAESNIGSTDSECIGDTVDVIEPGSDQRDLQDADVVEAEGAKPGKVPGHDLVGRCGQAHGEIEHSPILLGEVGPGVVPSQRGGKFLVEAGPTKKLDVALHSVKAAIVNGHDGGNH